MYLFFSSNSALHWLQHKMNAVNITQYNIARDYFTQQDLTLAVQRVHSD